MIKKGLLCVLFIVYAILGYAEVSLFHGIRGNRLQTIFGQPTVAPTPDRFFQEFQSRYQSPQEVLSGLSRDYGFEYDLGFWKNYADILKGDNSLSNILRNKKGVCQQFAELVAAGIEGKGYQFGIMVLFSRIHSESAADANHEIVAFKGSNGLWGFTSNDQYIAPAFGDLNELFYRNWVDLYSGYTYRDSSNFPADWVVNQDLLFQAPPLFGPQAGLP